MEKKLKKLLTNRVILHRKPLANKRKRIDTGFLFLAKKREKLYRFGSEKGERHDVYFKIDEVESIESNILTLK